MPVDFTRRDFIRHAACGAALAAVNGAKAAGRMRISMNSSLTRQMEWTEFVRLAARLGYDAVDVNLAGAKTLGIEGNRALFAETKIVPAVTGLPVQFGGTDEAYQQGLRELEDQARLSAAIGCTRMMAVLSPSSQTPKTELRPIVKQRITRIAEVLSGSNIQLALEYLGPLHFRTRNPHEFIWRMNDAVALARECGPNVGIVLDAWHWHHAGATVADIHAAGERVLHIHISDAKAQPPEEVRDNQRLMPGEGVIPLVEFLQALSKIGYDGFVSPEPIGRVPAEMSPEAGARLGLETTVAVMKQAGVR